MKKSGPRRSSAIFSSLRLTKRLAPRARLAKKILLGTAVFLSIVALPLSTSAQKLVQIWTAPPGSTAPLTNDTSTRTIDFNPVTGNLLFESRTGSNGVHRLNGLTGATNPPSLPAGTLIAGGSSLSFNAIGVADDGAIYGANVTDPAGASPFKLYRWDNEFAPPVNVYSGNLGVGVTGQRWGDMIAVRGSGTGVQILVGSDQAAVALLTTSTPQGLPGSWTAKLMTISGGTANFYKGGLTFLNGNLFYGKQTGNAMHLVQFDPVTGAANLVASISTTVVPSAVAGINFNPSNNLLVGVFRSASAVFGTTYVWNASVPNAPVYLDQKSFPTANADSSGQSCAAWGGGRAYASIPNNGIVAYSITPFITKQPSSATNPPGNSASFTVTADGTGPLTYQWRKNGTNISGATASNLTFTTSCADAGGYTVIVSNQSGSITSAVATLTVDTQPPFVFCPGNMSVNSTGPGGAVVNYTAMASDNCTPNPPVNCNPPSGSNFPNGTTTVNCTAMDGAGNTNGCSFTVTVTLPPLFVSCPGDQFAMASGPGGATVFYSASASGGCSPPPPPPFCNPPSGSTFPVGTTLVTCTASDSCNQSSNCTFNVTVTAPPPLTITCPADITTAATSPSGAPVSYNASASGGCSPPPFANCNPPSGSTFPIGTTTVNCQTSDACGQSAFCSFNVTVNPPSGPQPPEVFVTSNVYPPTNGVYIDPQKFHQLYNSGIYIDDPSHYGFTGGPLPPPPAGMSQSHGFGSSIGGVLHIPGQGPILILAPGGVSVTMSNAGVLNGVNQYLNEMTQLDINGGSNVPPGVMIRESPTLASTGRTTSRPVPGGYLVSSFFDVNTEVTTDGGATWSPGQQPAHMELRIDPRIEPPIDTPTDLLPPPNGEYISPQRWHALYAMGIIISNVSHKFFTQSLHPPTSGSNTHSFSSTIDLDVSLDGGNTFSHATVTAPVTIDISNVGDGLYDTEMRGLDVTSGLPGGLKIRESPTLPSRGGVAIDPQTDGTFRIHSFFDVFPEISTDGGATWNAPTSGPVHLRLASRASEVPKPTPNLPPLDGNYISPAKWHALYAAGIIITNASHDRFTQTQPPPPPGGNQIENFGSMVHGMISMDGGATFQPFQAPANVKVQVTSRSDMDTGPTRFFDTEMFLLNLSGGTLPGGVMLRESPTRASLGRTSIRSTPNDFRIGSFFDVFTEVSTDGGATWSPSLSAPAAMGLASSQTSYQLIMQPGWNLIANQLSRGSNTLAEVLPSVPNGSQLFRWNVSGQNYDGPWQYDPGFGWEPSGGTLGPGEGAFLYNPSPSPFTLTFVGETITPQLPLNLPYDKLALVARQVPAPATYEQITGLAPVEGTKLYRYDAVAQPPPGSLSNWLQYSFSQGSWTPGTPAVAVGEPVFIQVPSPQLSCPSDITVPATSPAGATVTYATPAMIGGCSPATATCNPPSGSTFPIGTTTVTCFASDACGQSANCSFHVTVTPLVTTSTGGIWFPIRWLPPTNSVYVNPYRVIIVYSNGIIISNVQHRRFTNSMPPPPPGGTQFENVSSVVDFEHSMDGGATFQKVSAPAMMVVRVTSTGTTGTVDHYDTEMLQLNISGGSLPAGVMLRESPTLASVGHTTIRPESGGFMIDSFFDVFTEISVDNGSTWSPAPQPHRVVLRKDPRQVPPIPTPTPILPPRNDSYISPAQYHILTAQGIVIKDVKHKFFTQSQFPPTGGGSQQHSFDSQVDMQLSQDGGNTFTQVRAPAAVTIQVTDLGGGLYDTEMLALDMSGGGLPAGIMIRESPTLASRGGTEITPQADGTYRIGSFFDIFPEVSTDGGANWAPAQSPAHVELICEAPEQPEPDPNLPPLNGEYISPQKYHALYASGIIISNVSHKRFLQNQPPPPPGGSQTHNFDSQVEMDIYLGGTWSHVMAPANVFVRVDSSGDVGSTRYFDTEMLALNMSGGGLPAGVMVRESPSKASLGRTSIRQIPDNGTYRIGSFFDIFTEVTTDNGATWSPQVSSPATMALLPPRPAGCIYVTCPPDIVTTATSSSGTVVTYPPPKVIADFCTYTVSCSPPSGSLFPIGTTTVTCTVTSSGSDVVTCTFNIRVDPQFAVVAPEHFFKGQLLLPPTNGLYISPQQFHQLYANGIIIRNPLHHFFTQSFPPPPPGPMQTHSFDSMVEFEHSMDGGATFHKVSAPAHVTVAVGDVNGDGRSFSTEMLALDISGGSLPTGVMLRESPTLQSKGQTTVRPVNGGYMIGSFFDIFTEISVDGGATWSPAQDAARVELRPDVTVVPRAQEPTSLLPPPSDAYVSPEQYHILTAQGIVIKDIKHSFFTQGMPPPAGDETQVHQFDSQVDMQLSMDGGQTFSPVRAPALVTVSLRTITPGPPQIYDTEMLQLDIHGGGLPAGVMIRESPTEPSRGNVYVDPTDDQTLWTIGSFFDIFTEVSMDGGQSWQPTQNGAAHMELQKVATPHLLPTPNVPPTNGQYISPAKWHALYANGIIISNISHRRFLQSQPPPPPGGTQTHTFGSDVSLMLSMNGGQTWMNVLAPGSVAARVTSLMDSGNTRYFDTEMLSLDIQGGNLPPGVMVRESPSKASLGRMTMTPDPASGGVMIDSFFDIFTEVSLDNGASWSPATSEPATVALVPKYPYAPFTLMCPADITTTATGPSGATVNYLVTFIYPDCPFGPFIVTCVPPSGSTFPVGMTTVTCTGSDGCGEHPTCSFKVTVNPPITVVIPEYFFNVNLLPPSKAVYISPQQFHQLYANGIIIRNPSHRFFTDSLPPPAPGASQTHQFGSMVEFEHSMDGGQTWHKVSAPAQVTVHVMHAGTDPDGTQHYDTEMLQLDISGGSLPAGVMVRESPSRPSLGQTTVRQVNGGYMIGSFFDIFTEISVDGGATWSPAQDAGHMEMRIDPETVDGAPHPTNLLPPPEGTYISPAQFHALYAQGIVIKDVRHSFFTQSLPPPPAGQQETHQFDSQVDLMLSTDGGQTFHPVHAPAAVSVALATISPGPPHVLDTEMLQLDIQGGGLPAGLKIRESPTLPSRGGTQIDPQADGSFRIHSFFDIFTEVSLDGGQSWNPAQNGPVRMEEHKTSTSHVFTTSNLPPTNGQYISPAQWHALYANGIIISNVSHQRFTQNQPPPPPGGSQTHNFGSFVTFMLSMNGGGTWQQVTAPAAVQALVSSSMDAGSTRYFNTEMLSLNIQGGGLPPGVMVRESPTRQSLGRTSMTPNPGGGYAMDSFFDIFTEVSVDGGQSWNPAVSEPAVVGLTPYPFAPFTITCPSNITTTATGPSGKVVNYTIPPIVFYPDCPFGPFTITCVPPSGSTFPVGTTTVTCTGSDGCGEHPTCTFTVTVNPNLGVLPPEYFFPFNLLPPPESVYISPALYHQLYANGIIIRNIRHRNFTDHLPPPPLGQQQIHSFNSQVDFEVSFDNGNSFQPASAPAQVSVRVTHSSDQNGQSFFDTEMLQLDIFGGGYMLRESPTLQSTGKTTVRQVPGGYMIGSFFDVFTELSLDGGVSWMPAQQAGHMEMRKDPTTVPPVTLPSGNLPPRNGTYISPQQYHILTAQGVVIKDVSHSFFTQSQPPPTGGGTQMHHFDSQVDMQISLDGGNTFQAVRAPAGVDVVVTDQGGGLYDTEMTSLTLNGGTLPGGVMIRESPSLPSRGGVARQAMGDGTYRIGSFFDIFPEVSLDGGQTWSPAQGPARVELVNPAPEHPFPAPNLPPLNGAYVSPQQYHALYAQGIVISNLSHLRFTQTQPPPPPGGSQTHSFGSDVHFMLSQNGGGTWTPVSAQANVSVNVSSSQDDGPTRFFDTEMLSLNISGGNLPGGVMVRESPSKASLGRTSVRTTPDGSFAIGSFFDIFTEVSLDGGQTWMPQLSEPVQMGLDNVTNVVPITINCSSNITVTATSGSGAIVFYTTTASGGCNPPPTVVCNPPSGSTFPIGTTTVTCTASDSCGGSANCSFTVKVNPPSAPPTEVFFQTNTLPPTNGVYISPAQFHQFYANGIVIRNARHRFFTQSLPPPPIGGSQQHTFGSQVDCEVSLDGGGTFFPVSAPAFVRVQVTSTGVQGTTRTFDTEMLQLDIAGGSLPGGVMLRESPTLASTGKTTVRQVPGGYMIGSFFDIFTEISVDGGVSWSPAQDAGHVELRKDPAQMAGVPEPTNLLPPPNDVYISPALFHQLYAQGIVIKDVRHQFFTQSLPPPAPGNSQTHTFDSQVDMMLSTDGGGTFMPVRASALVQVQVANLGSSGQDGLFDTEMLSLQLQGGGLPPNIMIRESPTLASKGGTQISTQPDGTFRIGSFFDIFTEVTLDGGATWNPATSGPVHVELKQRAGERPFPDSNLPPLSGQYVSPQQYHVLYANGIILSNVSHKRFTQSQPPPPPGGSQTHSFGSDVEFDLIRPGQPTLHLTAPASVQAFVGSGQITGNTRYFNTEMLSLNLSGGGLPAGVMVRESPSKASLGRTSVRQTSGQPQVSSFFDIFTEISTDGGATWSQQISAPAQMTLDVISNPCAGPANLQVRRGTNSVIVTWSGTGFRLQGTTRLITPPTSIIWTDIPGASGVEVPFGPNTNRFFRVICP